MNPQRARELLGGLSAGILTPEERQTLFEAALHDQLLFNEVADELEFAAFLQSPEARVQLANRIETEPQARRWWTLRPRWLVLSGTIAASVIVFVAIWHRPVETLQLAPPVPPATVPETKVSAPAAIKGTFIDKLIPKTTKKPAQPDNRAETAAQPERLAAPRFAAPMARAIPAPAMPPPPPAPASTASLNGMVHDPAGAPVAGAQVDILNTATNTTSHAISDASGRFAATSLSEGGPYTITAAAPGFAKKQETGITLAENHPAQVDIPLQIGGIAETVNLTAAAPVLLAGRNVTQVAVLDFANPTEQNQSGAQAADLLSSQLGNSGQVRVIDREKVQQASQGQNAPGHQPSAEEAAAVGRSVGADTVIVGSIREAGTAGGLMAPGRAVMAPKAAPTPSTVLVTAEIIDTKQAKPLGAVSAGGASLQRATASVGNQIQSRLAKPAVGNVTRVNGEVLSVKFGESPLPQFGARYDIIRGTEKIGEIVITSVSGQDAVGKFSGAGRPREGDRITPSR